MTTSPSIRVLILRLSNSRDTAASSTHRVLADLVLSAAPDAEIDFAFLPPAKAPGVTGLFSCRDWSRFDLILTVNSFVQEVLNLPWLLHANGVAAWASERPDAFPPVILGGSNAFAAQSLVRPDGQAVPDALFFGEAEESLPPFIVRWLAAQGGKRERLQRAADGLAGFWVTGGIPAQPIRQAVSHAPITCTSPQPLPDVETAGTVRIAAAAGCAAFCSFCFEGYERKPYREFPLADVLSQARALKASCGARTAELDAFNLNTYAPLAPLVETCVRLFDKVAFKSQRADGIAACPAIIDLERAAGKGSFTLGIEGISARLRAFLCKSLSDAELSAAVKALLDRRARELKLFFILTAHETPEDLAAFGEFCLRLRNALNTPGACTRIVLSFGRLVRMPNTPLALDRLFLDEADWRFCVDGVSAACRRAQLECRFAFDWPDYLGTQLLAACGHTHAEAVVALACQGLSFHGPWHRAEAERLRAVLPLDVCAERPRSFPFVVRAVSEAHLRQRWEAARQFIDSGYCLGDRCAGCGACRNADERDSVTTHARASVIPVSAIEAVARAEAEKRRLIPVCLNVELPDDFAGRSPGWVSARLMQTWLTRHTELIENVLSVEECLFSSGTDDGRLPVPAGKTAVALKAWDTRAALEILTAPGEPFQATRAPKTPTAFLRASWQLFTAAAPRDAAQSASAWLNGLRLPHTLRRDGEAWRIELAPAALKKKCVFTLCADPVVSEQATSGSRLSVTFSPKAELRDLLARLPPVPGFPKARCTNIEDA